MIDYPRHGRGLTRNRVRVAAEEGVVAMLSDAFGGSTPSPGQPDRAAPRMIVRRLLDTIYPPRCVGCRQRGEWLCGRCLIAIEKLPRPFCVRCRASFDHGGADHRCGVGVNAALVVTAGGVFGGPLRSAVHALKYQGRHAVARTLVMLVVPPLAELLQEGDLLIPIPLHPSRERQRGYNQSLIVARELAGVLPLDLAPHALRRVRRTAVQMELPAARRVANVRDAFAARPELVAGRRVWLLDDVVTTGATMQEAARTLREAGAIQVRGIALAAASRGAP